MGPAMRRWLHQDCLQRIIPRVLSRHVIENTSPPRRPSTRSLEVAQSFCRSLFTTPATSHRLRHHHDRMPLTTAITGWANAAALSTRMALVLHWATAGRLREGAPLVLVVTAQIRNGQSAMSFCSSVKEHGTYSTREKVGCANLDSFEHTVATRKHQCYARPYRAHSVSVTRRYSSSNVYSGGIGIMSARVVWLFAFLLLHGGLSGVWVCRSDLDSHAVCGRS